jgi:nucleotide-binding universal stress UspA family protein
MKMYSKILVPYDISMPADKALEHAVSLAKAVNNGKVEVILLHVIAELPLYPLVKMNEFSSAPRTASLIKHIEKVHDEASDFLAQMIEKKKKRYVSTGINIRSVVLKGIPVEKILEYAEKEKVDLIILGNVGWGEITKSKTLGSVARGVVERAHCSVTIVR